MRRSNISRVVLILMAAALIQCRQENKQVVSFKKPDSAADTIAVTNFSFEREDKSLLVGWQAFQDGDELITLPPDWKSTVKGQTLVMTPMNNYVDNEMFTFKRFDREGHTNKEDDILAQEAARETFSNFAIQDDSLKKLVFQHDFGYERNANVSRNGNKYKAYRLIYVNDNTFYEYNIILSKQRINSYRGNLLSDIVGNLKINNKYFLRTENPLKEIININI